MIDRVEELTVMKKHPIHINNHLIFKLMPGKENEDLQIEKIESNEVEQANGEDEQQPDIQLDGEEQQVDIEGEHVFNIPEDEDTQNYVTDEDTVKSNNESEMNERLQEIMDDFVQSDNQVDNLIEDINESRYDSDLSDHDVSSEEDDVESVSLEVT